MDRRKWLGLVASAGCAGVAGCGGLGGPTELSDPSTDSEPGERVLEWSVDGEFICAFGVSARVSGDTLALSTEIPHRDGTRVNTVSLRLWLPETSSSTEIALVAPVEGDSSPPPSVTLSYPDQRPGILVEVTDLDDLADETISTLDFLVRPRDPASELAIDATVGLTDDGLLATDYRLTGELRLPIPDLSGE
ncbi:hypothetical protein NDI56_03210 [Haloarcula sp. S1CR25-12]|uniref:DUF8121 domain-containing protein n=1 Tax=Haloarcula saliterrae TaxID=2950534 RepID=A0ABU2F875_9EURY|nr:hypothetical protein [Haloarcula sp. S1CR25-12]MDS0258416.1 hypothetical protein [Haloarcula sp. S1CR25-12]